MANGDREIAAVQGNSPDGNPHLVLAGIQ